MKSPHLGEHGTRLTASEAELLEKVAANLDIAADLAHADLCLLALPAGKGKAAQVGRALVGAQGRPSPPQPLPGRARGGGSWGGSRPSSASRPCAAPTAS